MKQICLLLLFTIYGQVYADTSVWKVSNGQYSLYIGGTIHVLSKQDYPLPDAYNQAYQRSQHLVFETDIDASSDAAFFSRLSQILTYKNGRSLRSALSPATFRQLEDYCRQANIPLATLLPLKPPFAALMLTALELQKLGIDTAGVDQHFNQLARKDGKSVGQLETIDEQLAFLANMARGSEDELILSTLRENQQLDKHMDLIREAWRQGNNAALNRQFVQPLLIEFPLIYQELLVQRNRNWLPQITKMLRDENTEFILVGTLHLVGRDGLIQQLQRLGYKTEQL